MTHTHTHSCQRVPISAGAVQTTDLDFPKGWHGEGDATSPSLRSRDFLDDFLQLVHDLAPRARNRLHRTLHRTLHHRLHRTAPDCTSHCTNPGFFTISGRG